MNKLRSMTLKIILLSSFLLCAFAFMATLFNTNKYAAHFLKYINSKPIFILFFSIVLGIVVYAIFKFINRVKENNLKFLIFVFSFTAILIQICAIVLINISQTTDAFVIEDQALTMAKGLERFIDESSSYFSTINNNNFLVLFEVYFFKVLSLFGISNFDVAFKILNTIFIDGSVVLFYLCVRKLSGKRTAIKFLFFSILNPLNYLLIFWNYSIVYCLPLMGLVLYLIISIWKNSKLTVGNCIRIAAIALVGIIGYFLRPVVLIPIIAISVCLVLVMKMTKTNIKKIFIFAAIFIVVAVGTFLAINAGVSSYVKDTSRNYPITHYLMIGLMDEGRTSSEAVHYTSQFNSKEEMKKAHIGKIKSEINNKGVIGLRKHLLKKTEITWSDGSADYPARTRHTVKGSKLWYRIFGDKDDFFIVFCQIYRCLILGLAAFYVLMQFIRKKNEDRCLVFNYNFWWNVVLYDLGS